MGAIGILGERYKPKAIAVGGGRPGPKSEGLLADRREIEHCRFYFPYMVMLTTSLVRRMLERCGVLDANEEDRFTKIDTMKLLDAEKQELVEALKQLPPEIRYHLLVRSDEFAGGTGINKSLSASLKPSGDEAADLRMLVGRIEDAANAVIANEFSPNALEFRRKMAERRLMEANGNGGVLLMPCYGNRVQHPKHGGIIIPQLSINYLGYWDTHSNLGYSVRTLGLGLGGANERRRDTQEGIARLFEPEYPYGINGFFNAMHIADGSRVRLGPMPAYWESVSPARTIDYELMEMLNRLTASTGTRQLELVGDSLPNKQFVVVQSAPFSFRNVDEPQIPEGWKKLGVASNIVGNKVVRTSKVQVVNADSISLEDEEAQLEYNRTNREYVLVIETSSAGVLRTLELSSFSNAAAIVIVLTDGTNSPFESHLDGKFRWLDIPVMSIEKNGELLHLLKNKPEKSEVIIYADERRLGSTKGWIALEQMGE